METVFEMTPDITVKLPTSVDGTNSQLRGFFQQIFTTHPIKFPVIYFTGKIFICCACIYMQIQWIYMRVEKDIIIYIK